MLELRIYTPEARATQVVQVLREHDGVHHVVSREPVHDGDECLVTAEVDPEAADDLMQVLGGIGVPGDAIRLVRLDAVAPVEAGRTHLLGAAAHGIAWAEIVGVARSSARPAGRYLTLMSAAGIIAAVGVATANEILIVGAMAISPDLLPLSAACVGLVGGRWRLAARSFATLVIGLTATSVAAGVASVLLRATDFLDQSLGSGGLGTLTTTDLTTVLVALAAGVAGMLAFETRAAAAVGVAISVTTIPAAAYLSAAVVVGDSGEAWGALGVLVTNLASLLLAGSTTLWVQRRVVRRIAGAAT